jgi:hypothetical protein
VPSCIRSLQMILQVLSFTGIADSSRVVETGSGSILQRKMSQLFDGASTCSPLMVRAKAAQQWA